MKRISRLAVAAVLAAVAAGCGDDGASADAGMGADASRDAGPGLAAPALPAPPMLTPCPSGWREVTSASGVVACDPWPEGGYVRCAAVDEARFPGADGCVRVGTACPVGDFADDLPASGTILYVSAGAAAGGDGSLARPFDSIGAATAVATTGTVIALGKGDYDEAVRLTAGVTLWGACVAETVVHSSAASATLGVLNVTGRAAVARNLRIGASARSCVVLDGLSADGTLEDVVLDAPTDIGIVVSRRAHLVARDVAVRDGTSRGMEIIEGGRLEAERVLFDRVAGVALFSTSAGSTVSLLDVAIVEMQSLAPPEPQGRAIVVQGAATLTASHVVLDRARDVAFFVSGVGSSATVEDLIVRDVRSRPSGLDFGRSLAVQAGAMAMVRRATISGFRDVGVLADGAATSLRLEDVVVSDGLGTASDDAFGRGVAPQHGATLALERVAVERTRDVAVFADGADTVLDAVDLRVTDAFVSPTLPRSGFGASLQLGASGSFTRVLLERTAVTGLFVIGATLVAQDLTVRETLGTVEGEGGDGISTALDGSIDATSVLVDDARRFGVFAAESSSFRARMLTVAHVRPAPCADTGSCPEGDGYGVGLASAGGASLVASAFVVDRAALCGVLVEDAAGLDLSAGRVSAAAIGACVQAPGFDLARLSADVTYVDNGRQLDTTTLPVPNVSMPLGTL